MFRRCVMSQVRRLATASSREHQKSYLNQTPLTRSYYRSQMLPTPPFNQQQQQQQLFVFRSFSTASPPPPDKKKDEGSKGKKDDSEAVSKGKKDDSDSVETTTTTTDSESSFAEWMRKIYEDPAFEFLEILVTLRFSLMVAKWLKTKYDYKKHVKEDKSLEGCLKYEIAGFKGADAKSIKAEIWNSRYLLVSGRIYNTLGSSVMVEREITLPNNDYSEAKKRAKFNPDVGSVVVEIWDFKKVQDINIGVEEKKK